MSDFSSLKVVGGLLSSDLLGRVFAGDSQVPGTSPESYGLERGESVRRQASRSWPYLLETWQDERKHDRFTRILLRELGFGQQIPANMAFRSVGWDVDLDHRTPNREARAPQSVVQQNLNEDDTRLWGLLTNGTTLRLLRDSTTLVSSTYVEFDLKTTFGGELFSDFVLLYLTCHASRWADDPCYLEQWRSFNASQGERVLDQLRQGVQEAIATLGTGFLAHPANPQLRARIQSRELRFDDFNRSLLRLVYRMLFWFVAEDRDALAFPGADRVARQRYDQYFSAARLRNLANVHRGTRHTDLFDAVGHVFGGLGAERGIRELALPGIGGIFETGALDDPIAGAQITNEALLSAVRSLSLFKSRDGGGRRRVDFRNLGAEELGSIYESLLELVPHYDPDERAYTLTVMPGNERKESGSYYTPSSLVDCLLDSALDPLLDEACSRGTISDKVAALLDLTVCDPACGSGHFLVAAARRIAKRIAALETGEPQPCEPFIRSALRRVVGRCIYGVDVNPMAAELAKVSLWLEALEPGKPMAYLDQNIRVGNSLLGTTPTLLAEGLPDNAFKAIEGDDKKVCTALRKQNAAERAGQGDLFALSGIPVSNTLLAQHADSIVHTLPESLEDLHIHQQRQADQLAASAERRVQKLLADAWCAAFVQRKTERTRPIAITHATLKAFAAGDQSLDLSVAEDLIAELTRQYRFFHWHIEFPHIFRTPGSGSPQGWDGGFTCVIGNPPWERIAFNDDEFFAASAPWVLKSASTAERKEKIHIELSSNQHLKRRFDNTLRRVDATTNFITNCGCYTLSTAGRLTTQAPFTEGSLKFLKPDGRLGLLVPTSVLTAVPMKDFWAWLVENRRLRGILDLENKYRIFRAVHASTKFSLVTLAGKPGDPEKDSLLLGVYIQTEKELRDPDRVYEFPLALLEEINPLTKQLPVCRSRKDVDLLLTMSRSSRPHLRIRPWNGFTSEGHSQYYLRSAQNAAIPLYEGKLIHQFEPNFATYEGVSDEAVRDGHPRPKPEAEKISEAVTRFYAEETLVNQFLNRKNEHNAWVGVVRRYVRSTDTRTAIASIVPRTVPIQPLNGFTAGLSLYDQTWALACINSFAYDFMAKLKTPGQDFNVTIMSQVPIPTPDARFETLVTNSVLELNYSIPSLSKWASALGDEGPPFRWDEERRFVMRCELDALFFHLYGIPRDDVDYIMETFPIVKRKDLAAHNTYRTKDKILEIYDVMPAPTGAEYRSVLDPAPGHGPRHPGLEGSSETASGGPVISARPRNAAITLLMFLARWSLQLAQQIAMVTSAPKAADAMTAGIPALTTTDALTTASTAFRTFPSMVRP